MKRHQEMITTIIVLGLACAVDPSESRELPEDIREFAAQEHQEILAQGREARRAISYKLQADFESQRVAFMESQGRSIIEQGRAALASIENELRDQGLANPEALPPARLARNSGAGNYDRGIALTLVAIARGLPGSEIRLVRLDHLEAWAQAGRDHATVWPAGPAGYAGSGS